MGVIRDLFKKEKKEVEFKCFLDERDGVKFKRCVPIDPVTKKELEQPPIVLRQLGKDEKGVTLYEVVDDGGWSEDVIKQIEKKIKVTG